MGETLRILLLEDVPSDAELVEIELRQAGIQFTALRVETEPEFRRALADFQPDLILADYALPSFNALEALRIVNQQSPARAGGVPFLLVTGNQSEEIAVRVMKEGAHDYLLKSSLTRLPSAVRNALERKVAHQAKLQAEEALRESEALLEEVGEMARVGGWQLDVETKQVLWTSETYRIHEIPEGERIELAKALLFYDLPERSTLETALQRCMETGEGFDLELPFTSAKGRNLWARASGRAVKADDKVIRLKGTFQDITDRKRLEQAMEKARADFLFAVSHELKTPLLVMGVTQEMIEFLPEEQRLAQFREYSDVWRRNLMRLRFIIENLVDSQRPTGIGFKLDRRPANLMDLAQEIATELEPLASVRSVQFFFQGGPLPPLSLDRNAVRRLLENLLTNAIKFSHLGGRIEIRLRAQGEMVCLDVCDFGMGIDPLIMPFLFQPFYRSPEAIKAGVQGTGLGLYVSKMIAEAHGGTIQLESEPGKGTTVTVRLPIQEAGS